MNLHYVSDADNSRIVPPDDPRALAAGIRWLLDHPREAAKLAERARKDVEGRTCLARARSILEFAETL